MATPLNTSALLQVDNDSTSETFAAGFTFTAGNDATAQFSHYNSNTSNLISSVTIGGTTATRRARLGGTGQTELYDAFNIAGGTNQVVVTYTGGTGHYVSGAVQEWSASDGLAYDTGTANTASGTSATPSVSTAASTSQNNTVIIASVIGGAGDSNVNITGPTDWTVLWTEQNGATHVPGRGAYHAETTTGTKTATFGLDSSTWAAAIAAYTVSSGTQALTPGLFTNSQTFYAATVTPGAVNLAPGLLTNSQTFYASTLTASYALTPALFTNEQVFYGPLVSAGAVELAPTLLTNQQTFYSATISTGASLQELLPTLLTNTQTFYGSALTFTYALTPGLLTNEQTFFGATVGTQVGLTPTLFTNEQIFYSATVAAGTVTLQPTLVTNEQTFYAPTILQQANVELLPGLLINAQTFFSPTVAFAQETRYGGWFQHPYARKQAKTKEERERERQALGITQESPAEQALPASVRPYHRATEKLLRQLPKVPTRREATTVDLRPSPATPTMAPHVLAVEISPLLLETQRKRAFEQDLVYIVATLLS